MDSLPAPIWFDRECQETLSAGIQLVAIEREAEAEPIMGRIRMDEQGKVWLSERDYLAWTGLSALPGETLKTADGQWYLLSAIPHRVDACTMRLQLAAQLPRRHYTNQEPFNTVTLPNAVGGFVNLDTFAFQTQNQPVRLATQAGFSLSTLGGLWHSNHVFLREGSQRLNSQVRWDIASNMTALKVGDILNNSFGLSPNVRFGGLSWGSDFSQRPEVATYPLPSFRGEATLPSSAELYIDGQLRQSNRLSSGPYALDTQTGINGAGDIQVIVKDSLGRETRISQPFYTSPKLLRAGLRDYHIDIGRLREGFATQNDTYTSGFLSARLRQGTEDSGTWGIRADWQHQRESLQGEWLMSHARWGLFQTGWGLSHDNDLGWGQHALAGYEWLSQRGNIQIQGSVSSPEFIELGRDPGAVARSLRAQTGWRLTPNSSISLGWSDEQRRDRDSIRLTTASWHQSLNSDRQVYLSLIHSPSFGLNSSLGMNQRLNSSWQSDVQLTQRDPDGFGLQLNVSWQPQASAWSGRIASEVRQHELVNQANLQFLGDHGNIRMGLGDRNGVTSAQTSISTAFAWVPGNVFWSKPIPQGFLVVDTGMPQVTVYANNQPNGKTDRHGQRLLTDIWPYQTLPIRLGWEDLPMSLQLGEMESLVRPPRGIAALRLARSDPQYSEAWQALLSTGEPLPTGSSLSVHGETATLPSGLDGLIYVPARWRSQMLSVMLPDNRQCTIDTLPPGHSTGVLTCQLAQ